MADAEWWCVETIGGTEISKVGELPPKSRFANREEAVEVAQEACPRYAEALTLVKHVRREVRTFTKKVTVEEADVSQRA